ncbi:nickel/cobalt ABC transporter permease [Acetobacterium wieringae]|uniref:Nickel import system permease protein NikB n=1 Tax=Acetobacterium wieringae TaxID=52694 RepID=A0A1F2PJV5_9FIRM|nr:nickel/cobalt ABC transporter permease [Acetobacterium wieringae]MEA4805682.1 nickel/cobalt ABC transporter permease [Acetobacterium wieringae]OFV71184.1 nickel transport system permease protein NikB [Acetobacterium wieringae]
MKQYFVKRLLWMIPILIGISFFAFILINLSPSDPAEVAIRVNEITPTAENVAQMREQLGLDDPFLTRYATWLGNALQGDFGHSYVNNKPVAQEIAKALPPTLYLAGVSLMIIVVVSVGVGVLCAVKEDSLTDKALRGIVFVGTAIPGFWAGILLMWLFAVKLKWLPTSGMTAPGAVILPAVTLALGYISTYVRLIRNTMIQNKRENYVLYGRVRGLSEKTITRHVFKNSLQTSLTALGMSIPKLIAGTVVIENIFAWPGIGRLCVTAIFNRDFPMIQAYVLIMAVLFVFCNLLVDMGSVWIDPRRREA